MSWLNRALSSTSKETPEEDPRETKRKKLEEERHKRAQQRASRQQQLQAAQQAQKEANEAYQALYDLAPDIFEDEVGTEVPEDIAEDILDDSGETMPDNAAVNFEDEDGVDTAGAMREASANLAKFNWDSEDLLFTFQQIEVKMSTVEVKKNWTKFQVLSTVLPKNVQEEVKHVLRKQQTDFPQKDSYKQLKAEILRIFGPKPDDGMARALSRVLTGTPSQLARQLVNDICKHELGCDCCPNVILHLWKRQLPSQVCAGIAQYTFNKQNFRAITELADKIFVSQPSSSVSAISSSHNLDETQPAIPYSAPEVAAIRGRGGRGRGRGNRGRGRGRGARGGQAAPAASESRPVTRHPDNAPPGSCSMHVKWGKSAHFCVEPASCPWKNIFVPKPSKNQ